MWLLQDLVPCILVTFDKEQIVVWRGKDYMPIEDGFFLRERESFDDPVTDMVQSANENNGTDNLQNAHYFVSSDEDE